VLNLKLDVNIIHVIGIQVNKTLRWERLPLVGFVHVLNPEPTIQM
jgi:hypothetical protein